MRNNKLSKTDVNVLLLFIVVIFTLGFGFGTLRSEDGKLRIKVGKVISACQKEIPKGQQCILEIKAVPEKKEITE